MKRIVIALVVVSLLAVMGAGAAVASVPSAPRNVLSTSLSAYYSFDTNGNDSASTNNLTNNNSVSFASAAKRNNGATFSSGSSQSLTIADNAALSLGSNTDFTVAGWVNWTGTASQVIVSKGDLNSYNTAEFSLEYYGSNLVFYVGNGTYHSVYVTAPSANTWHFVAAGYDSTNSQIWISVDGAARTNATHSGTQDTAYQLAFGKWANYAGGYLGGALDEWAYWKGRSLSSSDLTTLYNSGSGCFYVSGSWTCEATATPTNTNTPVPPTATNTPLPPTATNTPVPPTNTPTNTYTPTATSIPWHLAVSQSLSGYTLASGSVGTTYSSDNVREQFNEAAATANQYIEYQFNSWPNTSLSVNFEGYYTGQHTVTMDCYNYAIASWSNLTTLATTQAADQTLTLNLPTGCEPTTGANQLRIRLNHAASGSGTDIIYVDYLALASSVPNTATPTATTLPATSTPTSLPSTPTLTPTATHTPDYVERIVVPTEFGGGSFVVTRNFDYGTVVLAGVVLLAVVLFALRWMWDLMMSLMGRG